MIAARRRNFAIAASLAGIGFLARLVPAPAEPPPADRLPGGAAPLAFDGDPAAFMIEGLHRFLDAKTEAARAARVADSPAKFATAEGRAALRTRLRRILGADLPRVSPESLELVGTIDDPPVVASGPHWSATRVRWSATEGVQGEGLLLRPAVARPRARFVALPDADATPEAFAGLLSSDGGTLPEGARFARRLVESGCLVLIPTLIDRSDEFSGNPRIGKSTNQPHREFLYRIAFELGEHVVGYELAKIFAAIDWIERDAARSGENDPRIGVAGWGEGGMLALFAGALDERIDATLVSGRFAPRDGLWGEPVYRNAWGLLNDFGDAEIAALVAPRQLVVEACRHPEIAGPPPERDGRRGAAPGRSETPPVASVRAEFARAAALYRLVPGAESGPGIALVETDDGTGDPAPFRRVEVRESGAIFGIREVDSPAPPPREPAVVQTGTTDARERMRRQFGQILEATQRSLRRAREARDAFWTERVPLFRGNGVLEFDANGPRSKAEQWSAATEEMRRVFHEETIGAFPPPDVPPNPRSRLAYEEPGFVGYETMLDVWDGVVAFGVLLIPRDLSPGERRPVVVCQHGLEGRPSETLDRENHYYKGFAARLADEGFVVFAPQNPYIGGDDFRSLQRKANPLGKSLFSIVVGQHARILDWLGSLDFVDPARIGFYGLSYGGKTAMRVPAIEARYALSICSADFNEWIVKNAGVDRPYGYVFTGEYEIFEWDLGRTFDYAEMARLISPRPFMVERGHFDGVAPPEWVAAEFARVRFHYDQMEIGDRARMETFLGPHSIHGVGTFDFLRERLGDPRASRGAN